MSRGWRGCFLSRNHTGGLFVSIFIFGLGLAYRFFAKSNVIELLDVGPHENFYQDLQGYLDAR